MSNVLARDAKITECYFCIKTDFLPKYLQNSDFRPCVSCFNTWGKFKAQIQKVLSFITKNLFSYFFEISVFGLELVTMSS